AEQLRDRQLERRADLVDAKDVEVVDLVGARRIVLPARRVGRALVEAGRLADRAPQLELCGKLFAEPREQALLVEPVAKLTQVVDRRLGREAPCERDARQAAAREVAVIGRSRRVVEDGREPLADGPLRR